MIDYTPPYKRRTAKLLLTAEDEALPAFWLLGSVTGVKRNQNGLWLPADERIYEILTGRLGLEPSERARAWYEMGERDDRMYMEILSQEDSAFALQHPQGHRLRPFQRVAVEHIATRKRVLLCDDMGLGKTATAIVAVEAVKVPECVLVVCPNSLKWWWGEEKLRWTRDPYQPLAIIESSKREDQLDRARSGWIIANYAQVRVEPRYLDVRWDWVILDEAVRCRNRHTKTFQMIRQLHSRGWLLITGTPFGNNSSELWGLLRLIEPKRYTSFWRFYELYVEYVQDFWGSRHVTGVRNPELLRRELAPRMIRRTKEEVAQELPPKTTQVIPLEMDAYQARHYRTMVEEYFVEYGNDERLWAVNSISVLTRLRQILSTPKTLGLKDVSCKLDAATDLILGTNERVVVFAQFRATVAALELRLQYEGIPCAKLWGGMSSEEVQRTASLLNDGKIQVLISTLDAGGIGLNLVGASTAIFVDRHYNPERQRQATDRLHRWGQEKPVHIYVLHCPGTVDDLVEAILQRKISMSQEVLGRSLLETLGG